ncbi:hypothetical protein Tco_0184067 [Tanacetum coccineum]
MGENVYIWDLIDLDVTMSTSRGKFVSPKMFSMVYEVLCKREKTVADFSNGTPELIQEIFDKYGVHEDSFSRHADRIGRAAGIQVLRRGELRRQLQLWKRFREQIRHDDEIVLARVRNSTLEILIEDILVATIIYEKLVPNKNLYNDIFLLCVVLVNVDRMAPKRTPTSAAPAMSQAAIRKLVADSVATTLEAQAATTENTDNTNRKTPTPSRQREIIASKINVAIKEFIVNCQLQF